MPKSLSSDVRKKLETLRNRFRDKTIGDIQGLVANIQNASQRSEAVNELVAAYQLLHRLAGSAGTLGFTQLGGQARKLEIAIKPLAEQVTEGVDSERIRLQLQQLLDGGYERDISSLGSLLGAAEPVSAQWHKPKPAEGDRQSVVLILEPD